MAEFLQREEAMRHLKTKLKGRRVQAVWEVEAGSVKISALSGSDLSKAIELYQRSFREETIDVPITQQDMVETNRWTTKLPMELGAKHGQKLLVKVELQIKR